MKVLVFTSFYPNNVWPLRGVFIKERMTSFAALEGCEVKVVAPTPYFPPLRGNKRWPFSQVQQYEILEELEVYHPRYVMTPKVGMTSYGLMMFLAALPIVKKIQKNFDFDLIDSHFVYPDGFAAVLFGLLLGKPVVVSARGSDVNLYKDLALIHWLLQYTLCKADKVIAVSQALKEAIIELKIPEGKIAVVPNGVDLTKFYPFPKMEARKKLGLSNNRKIILSAGNLTLNKGFDLLMDALRILFKKYNERDLDLVIAGEGSFRRELERKISSLHLDTHVRLLGAVPHQELSLWYSAADLFCLASSREGWPNVLLESLACGTPVVATAVGGIPEILRSDSVGLLTERNEQHIAEGIALALKKSWLSDIIVHYAREHQWDRTALSIFHIFESVLKTYLEQRHRFSSQREDIGL